MKTATIMVSLIATMGLVSCSKETAAKPKRIVPATAAEITVSPDYKLEHTTKSGIKCYVRSLTPDLGKSIAINSPDYEFLNGEDQNAYYFLVLIRNDKIIDAESAAAGAMTASDGSEVLTFVIKRNPKMPEMLNSKQ